MKRKINHCLVCGCYDPDMGCTMPSIDKWYACTEYDNSGELAEILYSICTDMDCHDYTDTENETIKKLAADIQKAREMNLDALVDSLERICFYTAFK